MKVPTAAAHDEENGDAAIARSKHLQLSIFIAERIVVVDSLFTGSPKAPRDNELNQPRHHHSPNKSKHLRLIPTMEPADGKELLRRYEALQLEIIGKKN